MFLQWKTLKLIIVVDCVVHKVGQYYEPQHSVYLKIVAKILLIVKSLGYVLV